MTLSKLRDILYKVYLLNIPYKIYSLKFSTVMEILSFSGVILVAILAITTNNSSIIGTGLLTIDFILGPFIIWGLGHHFFYKEEQKFVSFDEYFDIYETELHTNINSPNFLNYFKNIENFLSSDTKLLLIYSLTGYGKSHLLREASIKANEMDINRINLFVVPNSHHLNMEEYLNKLDKRAKYLLIFDNVDINSEDYKKILSYCKNKDIKVILTFKTFELNDVLDNINDLKYDTIKIQWRENDLLHFFRDISGRNKISDNRIIIKYSNPSIILTKFEAITKSNFDFKKLDILVENMDSDIISCLKEFNDRSDEIEDLLKNIACIVPFPENNDEIFNILKTQTNFEIHEIKKIIQNLINGGLLIKINGSIRFNSDILGYLYLLFKIKDLNYEELYSLINPLISPEIVYYLQENIYKNLGTTSQIVNIFLENVTTINLPSLEQYFSDTIDQWIDDENNISKAQKDEIIKYLQYFCKISPNSSIDLINTYIPSEISRAQGLSSYYLNTDSFGPVIIQLALLPSIKKDIIDTIENMESKKMTGIYGNYKPKELITYLVSPFKNFDYNSIMETLNILESFLDDWNTSKLNILSRALNEVFSVSQYGTDWGLFSFQSYKNKLPETPKLLLIRNKALDILKKMVNHSSLQIKIESIKIAGEIGARDPKDELNLKDQLIKERSEILTEIGSLINDSTNFKLLSEIQDLFLNWWAQETPGTEEVEYYLDKEIFRNDSYIVSKHFIPGNYVIEDFDLFKSNAPSKDKWKWFVDMESKYLINYYEPNYYTNLVNSLNKKYNTPLKLITFLEQVSSNINDSKIIHNTPIIECWFGLNSPLFLSLKIDHVLWKRVPEEFKKGINNAYGNFEESYIDKRAEEILSNLPVISHDELNSFLTLLARNSIDSEKVKKWLNEILKINDSDIQRIIISRILHIFEDDYNSIAEILFIAISNESDLKEEMILELWVIMSHLDKNQIHISSENLKNLKEELIKKLNKIPKIDYHMQNLLNSVLLSIDDCLNFIKSRMDYYDQENEPNYRPIPSEGINYLKLNINSYNDFEEFLSEFLPFYLEKIDLEGYLCYILNSINNIPDSKNPFMKKYIQKQIELNNIENAIIMIEFLPLSDSNYPLFVEMGENTVTSDNYTKIKNIIHDKTSFNSYSGEAGKVPQEFKDKLKILNEMFKTAKPGKFRSMIRNLIENRKTEIKKHEERDEEFKYR